jgi:hypothetical protein
MTGAPHGLGWSRSLGGVALAAAGLVGATAALVGVRDDLELASVVLIYLVIVVAVAVVGGVWPALAAAVTSDLLVNFFFVPPFHTFTVESRDNLITVMVYVAVAITVSLAVNLAARQRAAAARHGIEAALLARITAAPLGEGSLGALLEHIRDTLGMTSAGLIEHGRVVAAVGTPQPDAPQSSVAAGGGVDLVVYGPPVFARHAGKLVGHQQLLSEVWGPRFETETNYLRVHMANLRRKLEPDPTRPRYLLTDPGLGYRLTLDQE